MTDAVLGSGRISVAATIGGLNWSDAVSAETLLHMYSYALGVQAADLPLPVALNPETPASLVVPLARLLTQQLRMRMHAGLSRQYRGVREELGTIRGHAMLWTSAQSGATSRGRMICEYEKLTVDTPRNRQFKATAVWLANTLFALEQTKEVAGIATDLMTAAADMREVGVASLQLRLLRHERVGRHDLGDAILLKICRLIAGVMLPEHAEIGPDSFQLAPTPQIMRVLFEQFVGAFCRRQLRKRGFTTRAHVNLKWSAHGGQNQGVPVLIPDVVIADKTGRRRLVIETKFTTAMIKGHHGSDTYRSSHLYQLFSYLASQPSLVSATGLLLYPATQETSPPATSFLTGGTGHKIRIQTIDLKQPFRNVRHHLLSILADLLAQPTP